MTIFRTLQQIAVILNFSEEEIMELIRQKRIPHRYYDEKEGRRYEFSEEEVLRMITPRPKKEETPFGPEVINSEPDASARPEAEPTPQPVAKKARGRKKAI